jgi:N-acetylglucosaminyl-diphospho-decaprenol L-rhamnosyltransferase
MRIVGIIINYRTPDLTIKVVDSLRSEMLPLAPFCIYLVDNASGDDSVSRFNQAKEQHQWQNDVEIIESKRNGGYGYGINLAVRRALALKDPPDYVYLLNSDAFVDHGSLSRMVTFADGHPKAGLVGSQIHGPDGINQVAAFRFPSVLSEFESSANVGLVTKLLHKYVVSQAAPTSDGEVDWISGTSMLIRRSTFEKTGLFDEGFFLYFEEIDFCRSAREAGCKVFFVTDAPITHIGAVSTGMKDGSRRMPTYWFDSRYRYFRKHHGVAYATTCDVARTAGMLIWKAKARLLNREEIWRPRYMRDFLTAGWKNLLGYRG